MNLLTCSKQTLFAKRNSKKNTRLLTHQIVKAMKLTFILLTAAFLQVSAKGISQNVTLILKDAPIEKVFREIERQTGLGFLYTKKMLQNASRVNINVKDQPVAEVLKQCFKDQLFIYYSIVENTIVIKPKEEIRVENIIETKPPPIEVKGRVVNENGEPMEGVTVIIKGTKDGTVTNKNGEFVIQINSPRAVLIFTSVGYEEWEVEVGDAKAVPLIKLKPLIKTGEDIIIVGYGKVERRKLTGSVGTLKPDLIGSNPLSPDKLLQGRIAGVLVSPASGAPGTTSAITIRGVSTLSDAGNSPLIVIDGVPTYGQDRGNNTTNFSASNLLVNLGAPSQKSGYTPRNQFERNPLSDINPDDIESIEILKDAYATSIYGSRAAAGVILITTKKGNIGKPVIDINFSTTSLRPFALPDIMNGDQYAGFYSAYYDSLNAHRPTAGWPPANRLFKQGFNTNWVDEIVHTGIGYDISASISGGNEKTKYFVSGGYNKEASYVINNDLKRYQGRINVETKLSNRLKVGTTVAISYTNNNALNAQRAYFDAVSKAPNIPVLDSLGIYTWRTNYSTTNIINGAAPLRDMNAVGTVSTGQNYINDLRSLGSVFAELKLTNWLTYRFDFGVDWYNTRAYSREIDKPGTRFGSATESNINNFKTVLNNLLNFNKRFGNYHSISGVIGQSFERSKENGNTVTGTNFPDDRVLSINSATTKTVINALQQEWTLASFIGRIDYGYKDKYLLGITNRIDGSSRFSLNNRYLNFPSVSAGWVISKENFMKNTKWINELKVRGSWGLTGTDGGAGYYGSQGQYSFSTAGNTYAGTPLISATRPANPDLKWQQTTNYDLGLDAALFNNKVRITADYYSRVTKNLLALGGLPGYVGFSTQQQNLGELKNSGFEFTLTTKNIERNNFSWTSSLNFASNKNIITKLYFAGGLDAAVAAESSGGRFWQEGNSATSFYFFEWGGVDPATGNPIWVGTDTTSQTPFEIVYFGTSKNFNTQRKNMGDALPKLFGGFDNRIQYKGFEFSRFFSFAVGYKVDNGAKASMYGFSSSDAPNLSRGVVRYWRAPGDITDIPALINKSNTAFSPSGTTQIFDYTLARNSSRFLEDGSFLRLRNITFAYTLPKDILKKAGLLESRIKIYAEINNLFIITKYTGIDPEVSAYGSSVLQAGYDEITMPNPRSFRFGFKIGL